MRSGMVIGRACSLKRRRSQADCSFMGVAREIPPIPTVFAGKNGRRHNRIRCVSVPFKDGEVLDISSSGAKLRWRGRLRAVVGDIVAFEIENVDDKPIPLRGNVMWITRQGWRRHELGIEFTGLSEDALRELVTIAKVTSRW